MHYFDNKMGARNKRSEIRISVLFGFRKTIVDGTRKREIARQVYLNRANLSFYCNSCKAILIRNAEKRNAVSPKAFCTPCFFSKKRASTVSVFAKIDVGYDFLNYKKVV